MAGLTVITIPEIVTLFLTHSKIDEKNRISSRNCLTERFIPFLSVCVFSVCDGNCDSSVEKAEHTC